jgi:AraC family transcriptional regulator
VHCARTAHARADEEHSPRATLVLPQRGVFRYHVGNDTTIADPNTALLLHPDQSYCVTHPNDAGDDCLALYYDRDTLTDTLGLAGEATWSWALSAANQRLLHASALQSLHGADVLEREESAIATLSALAPLPAMHRRTTDAARIEAIRERLAANVSANDSLGMIARDAGLSPFHLARQFRAYTGSSIHQYLLALRLATAHTRMRDGANNLTRLAVDLGFSSLAHFSSTFRRAYGAPPSRVLTASRSRAAGRMPAMNPARDKNSMRR